VLKNRVLRKIFGPKRDEVTGELWRLHSDELYDLYYPPSIFRVVKTRRMKCDEHKEDMGKQRCIQGFGGET
jgi:hypothetical protein